MRAYIVLLLVGILMSGCLSPIDPTPSVKADYTSNDPQKVKRAFIELYNGGYYRVANTLMCEPDSENVLYREAEAFYKATIGSPESVVTRMKMQATGEFDYFDDTRNCIEEQTLRIREHYYFKYYQLSALNEKKELSLYLNKKNGNYCVSNYKF